MWVYGCVGVWVCDSDRREFLSDDLDSFSFALNFLNVEIWHQMIFLWPSKSGNCIAGDFLLNQDCRML